MTDRTDQTDQTDQTAGPTDGAIIDMWAPFWPTLAFTRDMDSRFPEQMLGYLRVFFKRAPDRAQLEQLFGNPMSEQAVIEALDSAGIGQSLVTGFDEHGSVGKTFIPNQMVAELAERHPDRVIPFAGADVLAGMRAVRELQRWVTDHGFRGLSLRPFMIGLPADDRRYYPFYAKCVELDIPVSIHMSANWTTVRSSELGHPRVIDTVAADFPELRIVVSHGGYPWVLEAALLAWKHPNVYLELAAHRPRYLAAPGSGWEPLFRFGTTTIRDKVLFGTGWVLLGQPLPRLVEEFRALPVPEPVMQQWLHGNAARLLAPGSPGA